MTRAGALAALALIGASAVAHAQPAPPPGWGQTGGAPPPAQPAPGAAPQGGGWGPAPQPQPGGYAPQPQPGGYAPQPQPGGYAPQPQPGGYAPQPQPGGYAPQPQPGGYAPWGPPPPQPQWGPTPPQPWGPAPAPKSDKRDDGEMVFLYVTSLGYGIGTGVGIDLLANVKEPAVAALPPILIGAAVPVGVFFLDRAEPFHAGVPAATATGVLLGAGGGILLSTAHYSLSSAGSEWSPGTYSAISILTATGGGIGGYAFGEWLRPDPRELTFIASGAGWGTLTGGLLGAGVSGNGTNAVGGGLAVGGLLGYGAGMVGSGALAVAGYKPSYTSQKWMWLGYVGGVGVTSLVYIAYAFTDGEPKRGLIANAFGGLAGLTLAAIFTANDTDGGSTRGKVWSPPFQLAWQPAPNNGNGGLLTASGMW